MVPNVAPAPLAYQREEQAPVGHSQAPGRGDQHISSGPASQCGDSQPVARLVHINIANGVEEMETDGEIEVDDCDDCEYDTLLFRHSVGEIGHHDTNFSNSQGQAT